MATFAYSFTFANAATTDGGNIQTDMNDLRTFLVNSVSHSDAVNYPTGLGTFGCRARRVAVQLINNNTRTAISWDTIDSDPNTMVSGTNVTVKSAGWYIFCAAITTTLVSANPTYITWHFTVGPTLMPLAGDSTTQGGLSFYNVGTMVHKCALNEVVQAQFLHTHGSNQNVQAYMYARKISAL